MSFLNIGKKDRDGRHVRIEHRSKHLRASRTGGVAFRKQIRAGGFSLTANTQRGTRVSMTPARNTQIAFQNFRFVLRGRYGKGPLKVNLSKSGLSLSTKAGLGTINLTNPGRSSAKVAGIQMRGKNAAAINIAVVFIQILVALLRIAVILVVYLVVNVLNLAIWTFQTTNALISRWRLVRLEKKRSLYSERIEERAAQWIANNRELLDELTPGACLAAMEMMLDRVGSKPGAIDPALATFELRDEREQSLVMKLVERLFLAGAPESATVESTVARLPEVGLAVLAIQYRAWATSDQLLQTFFRLDEAALEHGPRTTGEELLLEALADLFGLRLEMEEEKTSDQ